MPNMPPEPVDPYPYEQTADVPATSMLWVQDLIRTRLRLNGTTPALLSDTVGDSASTWRNKLNGTREFKFEDLLRIAIALDGDLFADLPFADNDLGAYFPPAFRPHLSHDTTGHGMPSFDTTPTTWDETAMALGLWLAEETTARRLWLLTSRGIAREVLTLLESAGLPSTQATLAATTDTSVTLDWLAHDTRICFAVPLELATAHASSEQAREVLVATAAILHDLADSGIEHKALILIAPTQIVDTLASALRLDDEVSGGWTIIGLTELHRLGSRIPSDTPPVDLHVQLNGLDPQTGFLWLRVK